MPSTVNDTGRTTGIACKCISHGLGRAEKAVHACSGAPGPTIETASISLGLKMSTTLSISDRRSGLSCCSATVNVSADNNGATPACLPQWRHSERRLLAQACTVSAKQAGGLAGTFRNQCTKSLAQQHSAQQDSAPSHDAALRTGAQPHLWVYSTSRGV